MFLLVRDEDPPTVAAAIRAFAVEEGLEPIDVESEAQNPFTLLGVLTAPRVTVAADGDQVLAFGVESLDIAEADEWGSHVSRACETEVIVVDVEDGGVHVYVFDEGELDEELTVRLDPSGTTRAADLAELAESDAGARELENGIRASTQDELLQGLLRCLGASAPGASALVLAFRDPLDDEEDEGEADDEPALAVQPLPGVGLDGKVGGPVATALGNVFGITLRGRDAITGVRLAFSGDALGLFTADPIDVYLRVRDALELEHRVLTPVASDDGAVVDLPDAFLERVEGGRGLDLDPSDLFATMQRLMSAGDAQLRNTILVRVSGTGRRAGEGALVLVASTTDGDVAPGEASVPVRVRS